MSSRSLNKVMIIGNLTRDPELRYTPQGTPVCTIGIATNRSWVDSNNQRQEETEYHRVVAWNKLAELCSQLLFKGRKVYVEGRLQTRNWTTQDGQERQTTEVVIDDMIVLDNRRREGEMAEVGDVAPAAPAEMPSVSPAPVAPVTGAASTAAAIADDTVDLPQDEGTTVTELPTEPEVTSVTEETSEPAVEPAEEEAAAKPAKDTQDISADDIPF